MGKSSTKAKNKYNVKTYDRISISVKKGIKDVWQIEADKRGESLTEYISSAIEMRMKSDNSLSNTNKEYIHNTIHTSRLQSLEELYDLDMWERICIWNIPMCNRLTSIERSILLSLMFITGYDFNVISTPIIMQFINKIKHSDNLYDVEIFQTINVFQWLNSVITLLDENCGIPNHFNIILPLIIDNIYCCLKNNNPALEICIAPNIYAKFLEELLRENSVEDLGITGHNNGKEDIRNKRDVIAKALKTFLGKYNIYIGGNDNG